MVMIMKKMDKDGLLLCDLQGETFEKSLSLSTTSSAIFIRRFMHSNVAKLLDNKSVLMYPMRAKDIIDEIDKEYGKSTYGSIKYSKEEMYWIGYIYRYFAYTYEIHSTRAYRIIKSKELRDLYLAYHTFSPEQAIKRILEAKNIKVNLEDDIDRQYAIYKKLREEYDSKLNNQ